MGTARLSGRVFPVIDERRRRDWGEEMGERGKRERKRERERGEEGRKKGRDRERKEVRREETSRSILYTSSSNLVV